MAVTFRTYGDVMGIEPPTTKAAIDVWHEVLTGFGVRIGKRRADGKVRRSYISRIEVVGPDGKEKEERPVLGLVQDIGTGDKVISFKDAEAEARKIVAENKLRRAGGTIRMTLNDAYEKLCSSLDSKHSADSPAYGQKMRSNYDRFLAHLGNRYLDELQDGFWIDYLDQLRGGTLCVGVEVAKDGKEQPALRKAGPVTYATGILNTASRLYRLAHDYGGISGQAAGWDPTRKAVGKMEIPNERETFVELKHLRNAWIATDQLMSPWWRDLWRVYLLTGLRDRLVMDMRWEQIDFERGLYLIDPLQRGTKRQRKKLSQIDREKMIEMPLSRYVMGILKRRKMFAPSGPEGEYVWYSYQTARRKKTADLPLLTDPRSSWKRLTPVIGYWCYKHDLRRTFSSVAATVAPTGVLALSLLLLHSSKTVSKALGIPTITVKYIKEQQRNMRAVTEKVSQAVLEMVGEAPVTALTQHLDEYENLPDYIDHALMMEERANERYQDVPEAEDEEPILEES